jgi:hypothetical protein
MPSPTNKNKKEGTPLPADFVPGNYDVVCAKGKAVANHVGNRRFRVICRMHLDKYSSATTKQEKSRIVSDIVDTIRRSSGKGGFVKLDPLTGIWRLVSDHHCREKVGQTLRDALHTKYSSSTKAKKRRRQAEKARAHALSTESQPEVPIAMPNTLASFTELQQSATPSPVEQILMGPPRPVLVQSEMFTPALQVPEPMRPATDQVVRDQFLRPIKQPQQQASSLRKNDSSSLLDIFFDEKHYEALKELNDELNPTFALMLSQPSPNIVRGKAA